MTETSDSTAFQLPAITAPPDDALFDFDTDDWIDPPVNVTNLLETTPESNIRALAEQEYYHHSTTFIAWTRYLSTLCRCVVDGFTFDKIWKRINRILSRRIALFGFSSPTTSIITSKSL